MIDIDKMTEGEGGWRDDEHVDAAWDRYGREVAIKEVTS